MVCYRRYAGRKGRLMGFGRDGMRVGMRVGRWVVWGVRIVVWVEGRKRQRIDERRQERGRVGFSDPWPEWGYSV